MKKRVVVTGGSVVTPLGENWEEIEKNLREKRSGVCYMEEWEKIKSLSTKLGAPAIFTKPDYPRKSTRGMGRVALMAVATADRALMDAKVNLEEIKNGRCGVSYGSSSGSPDAYIEFFGVLSNDNAPPITATTYIRCMPHTCAANIGVFFETKGRLLTSNTACTAGALSIGLGFETVQNGCQDMMICGGAEELSPTGPAIFDTLFAASLKNDTPKKTPKPYDKDRDGLVIGEGAGTIILETLESAEARGANIVAELVGFGSNTDGTHITQPNRVTMQIVIEQALESAGLTPQDIGFISSHGTATEFGDLEESWATYGVFKNSVPVSGIKGYTGHTLGACGAIEAWLVIQMMNKGWFNPNLNLENVDPKCAPLDYIMGEGREINTDYVMSNNFAFGGINNSLIFKKWK